MTKMKSKICENCIHREVCYLNSDTCKKFKPFSNPSKRVKNHNLHSREHVKVDSSGSENMPKRFETPEDKKPEEIDSEKTHFKQTSGSDNQTLAEKRLIRPVMGNKMGVYPEKDVKEFILRDTQLIRMAQLEDITFEQLYKERNKLAGKGLI